MKTDHYYPMCANRGKLCEDCNKEIFCEDRKIGYRVTRR